MTTSQKKINVSKKLLLVSLIVSTFSAFTIFILFTYKYKSIATVNMLTAAQLTAPSNYPSKVIYLFNNEEVKVAVMNSSISSDVLNDKNCVDVDLSKLIFTPNKIDDSLTITLYHNRPEGFDCFQKVMSETHKTLLSVQLDSLYLALAYLKTYLNESNKISPDNYKYYCHKVVPRLDKSVLYRQCELLNRPYFNDAWFIVPAKVIVNNSRYVVLAGVFTIVFVAILFFMILRAGNKS